MKRSRVLAAACAVAVLWAAAPALAGGAETQRHLAVPAYFDPRVPAGLRHWNTLIATAPVGTVTVMTAGNLGPGPVAVPEYQDAVARARRTGRIKVLCYVETKADDGTAQPPLRPYEDIAADTARCFEQYRPDGIFYDEIDGTPERLGMAKQLWALVKGAHPKALVALNAGQNTVEEYVHYSDIICNFEGPYRDSPIGYNYGDWTPAEWVKKYPADHFWQLVYGTSETDMAAAVRKSRGYVYVTDGTGGAKWDHLPPYWRTEIRRVTAQEPNRVPRDGTEHPSVRLAAPRGS